MTIGNSQNKEPNVNIMDNKLHKMQSNAFGTFATCALATLLSLPVSSQNTLPAPANLHATADFSKVTLTWENAEKLDTLLKEDFEDQTFPSNGWSVKTVNDYDPLFTWFHYPTDDIKENVENYTDWIYSGNGSAAIMFDDAAPHDDETSAVQNEWLIMPASSASKYLSFYTYIDPQVLEWGADAEFPDHYYVKVSHDNGATWEELWDARYDSNGASGWQFVTLYIGNDSGNDNLVAFQAVGDTTNTESGLYFSWVIDDVMLLSAKALATPNNIHSQSVSPLAGRPTHRSFTPSGIKAIRPRRAPQETTPTECYNVYLDNERIAENIKTNTYTDTSDKEPGEHTYAVQAVSLSQDMVSSLTKVQVDIKQPTLNAPTNIRLSYIANDDNTGYNVTMAWDEPEGERKPSYYNTYCNGALFGGYLIDLSVGQSNVAKGVYTYSVVAVYENPDGESEPASDVIAIGTRNTVRDLVAETDESGKTSLSWKAPKASEYTMSEYAIFRGNERIGKTEQTTFDDTQSPEGLYDYSVKVIYTDGVESLPISVSVKNGTVPSYKLPFSENFTGGLKPGNWTVEKVDGKMKDSYLWRFDNWYDLPISGNGFEGEFASVTSSVAGYTNVFTTLDTPPLLRNAKTDERTVIEFDMDYQQGGRTSSAGLYYSYDGENWGAIDEEFVGYETKDLTGDATCQPVHKKYDITLCFTDNDTPVYLAWKYNGKQAYHLAIDNVNIYNTTSTSVASAKIGALPKWRIDNGMVVLSGNAIQRVQAFAPNGMCVADVNVGGANEYAMPLTQGGIYMLKVTASDGTKIIKIGNSHK